MRSGDASWSGYDRGRESGTGATNIRTQDPRDALKASPGSFLTIQEVPSHKGLRWDSNSSCAVWLDGPGKECASPLGPVVVSVELRAGEWR